MIYKYHIFYINLAMIWENKSASMHTPTSIFNRDIYITFSSLCEFLTFFFSKITRKFTCMRKIVYINSVCLLLRAANCPWYFWLTQFDVATRGQIDGAMARIPQNEESHRQPDRHGRKNVSRTLHAWRAGGGRGRSKKEVAGFWNLDAAISIRSPSVNLAVTWQRACCSSEKKME